MSITEKAPTTAVRSVVRMSASDKSVLDNPLTMEKPVYRTEEYYEGGAFGLGGVVYGEKKTRQVLDHYETVPATDAGASLSYVGAVADFQRKYGLSSSVVKAMCDSINSGGSALELGNDWLVLTDEALDPNIWHAGTDADIEKTPEGFYLVTSKDGRSHFTAKRVAIRY